MTYKFEWLAVANCGLSLLTYFSSPILTFALPFDLIVYGYWFTTVLNMIVYAIDYYNSDCFDKNYQIMKASGISQIEIWGSAAVVLFSFQLPGIWLMTNMFPNDFSPSEWSIPNWKDHWNPVHVLSAICMVAATDGVFFICHRWLHTMAPRTHLLHHACVHSSQLANLFFNPFDLAAEFTAPVISLFVVCRYVYGGAWMFALCLAITQAWYASGHDEYLNGHHVQHHKSCATGYFIYHQYTYMNGQEEKVRHLISDPTKQHKSL